MKIKTVSSLEKCFLDENIEDKKEQKSGSALKGEKYHFLVCYEDSEEIGWNKYIKVKVLSELAEHVKISRVEHVPVHMPRIAGLDDDNYLRKTPGLYPDLLIPVGQDELIPISYNLESFFVEVTVCESIAAGIYPIEFLVEDADGNLLATTEFTLEIIDATLPEQELIFSQWFYTDCLQDFYNTGCFDEEHWRIIENFMSTAVKGGVNMMLTPIFTPPLDTAVGGTRGPVQLVDISLSENGYAFYFDKLGRWLRLCEKTGIKYLEICHLFTQWGAAHAPNIFACEKGETVRIFGWETDADSKEYRNFLESLIPELLKYLNDNGWGEDKLFFHISDEPSEAHIESYRTKFKWLKGLIGDIPIIDALSEISFLKNGAAEIAVASNDKIDEFIEEGVKEIWTYYCCSQGANVSNRFIAMPSARNRITGIQLYKYGVKGFLHWGYNFYNKQYSRGILNPYTRTDGMYFGPSGDAFSVYPARDGTAYESVRFAVFHDGLQDLRALRLCEELIGKQNTLRLLEEGVSPITFKEYPKDSEWLLRVREKINLAIKQNI